MARVRMISGDEHDALTKGRHLHRWRPGERRRIKRGYRRRERHVGRQMMRAEAP